MTIDEEVEKSKTARCFFNGKYQYRNVDKKEGKNFCAMSDDKCPYYKKEKNKEYCNTTVYKK